MRDTAVADFELILPHLCNIKFLYFSVAKHHVFITHKASQISEPIYHKMSGATRIFNQLALRSACTRNQNIVLHKLNAQRRTNNIRFDPPLRPQMVVVKRTKYLLSRKSCRLKATAPRNSRSETVMAAPLSQLPHCCLPRVKRNTQVSSCYARETCGRGFNTSKEDVLP